MDAAGRDAASAKVFQPLSSCTLSCVWMRGNEGPCHFGQRDMARLAAVLGKRLGRRKLPRNVTLVLSGEQSPFRLAHPYSRLHLNQWRALPQFHALT